MPAINAAASDPWRMNHPPKPSAANNRPLVMIFCNRANMGTTMTSQQRLKASSPMLIPAHPRVPNSVRY